MATQCTICNSASLVPIIERVGTPVFQNAVYRDEKAAAAANTGRIKLVCCADCGFVFNAGFDSSLINYGQNYENDQSHSQVFLQHMEQVADCVLSALRATGGSVVEVGCGQGGFLVCLRRRSENRIVTLQGFDPSFRGGSLPEGITIWPRLLDEKVMKELGTSCDVVVTRHVIEHVPDPVGFFATIRKSVPEPDRVRLFVETPAFEWIVANRVLQDVFYEHVNYFTADTLALALAQAGFGRCVVTSVFGGQYLWADASAAGVDIGLPAWTPQALAAARQYVADVEAQIAKWHSILDCTSDAAVWGAGAKGVTFTGLVDPNRTRIAVLVDINPKKQNAFAPTGHRIVSPAEAARMAIPRIVLMNPNYEQEVRAILDAHRWKATIVGASS